MCCSTAWTSACRSAITPAIPASSPRRTRATSARCGWATGSHILAADPKRLYVFHEMFHADEGYRAATQELMHLHVNLATRRVTALPDDKLAALQDVVAKRGNAPLPPEAGRRIAMPG
jgi:hypothetical protein